MPGPITICSVVVGQLTERELAALLECDDASLDVAVQKSGTGEYMVEVRAANMADAAHRLYCVLTGTPYTNALSSDTARSGGVSPLTTAMEQQLAPQVGLGAHVPYSESTDAAGLAAFMQGI